MVFFSCYNRIFHASLFWTHIFNLSLKCAKLNLGNQVHHRMELIQILQRLSGIDVEWLSCNNVSLYKSSIQENITRPVTSVWRRMSAILTGPRSDASVMERVQLDGWHHMESSLMSVARLWSTLSSRHSTYLCWTQHAASDTQISFPAIIIQNNRIPWNPQVHSGNREVVGGIFQVYWWGIHSLTRTWYSES
jgi:hypothetical protein